MLRESQKPMTQKYFERGERQIRRATKGKKMSNSHSYTYLLELAENQKYRMSSPGFCFQEKL